MSDWYLSPRPQRTLETLRLFYRATAQFLVWWVWSRTELGSRPRAWRFSVAECQQKRPACPWRARWRSAASKEGQRRVLQRPPCIMTTDCPILNYDHYIRSNQDSASNRGLWITKLFWGTCTYCRHQFCYTPEFQYNNNKGDFEQHPMSHIVEVRSKHTLIIHMNVVFFLGFQGSSFSWME